MKDRLLWNVKKEVKQIMEEAVTRKFVHEDSSHIIALCGVVEACLLHMLKRRAAGFLRTDKVAALFTKVGKTCAIAADVCKKVQELQQQVESRKNQPNGQEPLKRQGSTTSKTPVLTPQAIKHIWVRTALIEKVLDKIVQYIVDNCSKYYEKEALLADPVCGPILASLLVGPCALEYTKLKTADHYWTDPSADELVQRHRIHGAHGRQDSPCKRPALGVGIYSGPVPEPGHGLLLRQPMREVPEPGTAFLFRNGALSHIRNPFGPRRPLYLNTAKCEIQN